MSNVTVLCKRVFCPNTCLFSLLTLHMRFLMKVLSIGHFLSSRYSIDKMKEESGFLQLLKRYKVQFHIHKWELNTLELRTIGFVFLVNPGHKNENVATEEIETYMDKTLQTVKFSLHFLMANTKRV